MGTALALLALLAVAQAAPLGAYVIDHRKVSVSGLSSGAYMAVQLHVAFSATFTAGVGAVAGGPYYCARGSVSVALTTCMTTPSGIRVADLVAQTRTYEASKAIDPLSGLANSPVYIYAGLNDGTVDPGCSDALFEYYNTFVTPSLVIEDRSVNSGHAMITDFFGNGCSTGSTPYINNCNHDLAGRMLQHFNNGTLRPRETYKPANLFRFDQFEFGGSSMDNVAFVYVPTGCQQGATCGLHVALHGCLQNWDQFTVGTKFVEFSGYNEWAEANNIIVLYPQTEPDLAAGNANACWDWWGYADRNYAVKVGKRKRKKKKVPFMSSPIFVRRRPAARCRPSRP